MVDGGALDRAISSDIEFRVESEPSLLADAFQLRVHAATCPREGDGVYQSPWHLLEGTLTPGQPIWTRFRSRPRRAAVPVGRVMFVPKGEAVDIHFTRGTRRTVSCLFDLEALGLGDRGAWEWDGIDVSDAFDIRDPFVHLATQRLGQEALAPSFASTMQVECTLLFLAAQLQRCLRPDQAAAAAHGLTADQIRRVKERIEDGASVPSMRSLADAIGLSPQALSTGFRVATGQTLRAYAAGAKLDKAKRLLIDEQRMIKQIAFECGFRSPASFAMAFRQQTGMSPREYRTKVRAE